MPDEHAMFTFMFTELYLTTFSWKVRMDANMRDLESVTKKELTVTTHEHAQVHFLF